MPLVELNSITREKMLAAQALWGMSDSEFEQAVCGRLQDPGKVVRAWKSGRSDPSQTAQKAFYYLSQLVRIVNNTPVADCEENYHIAFSALPESLK